MDGAYHFVIAPSEEVASMKTFRFGQTGLRRWGGYLAVFGLGLLLAQVSDEGWASRAPAKVLVCDIVPAPQ